MVSVGTKMMTCPSTKSVATQLSYGTLKNRVRSKGVYGIRTVNEYDLMQNSDIAFIFPYKVET